MDVRRELREHLARRQAVGPGLAFALFGLLQQAGQADFHEFVQIAGGDGQKFHALEKGIVGVERLFQHPAIELHPGKVPVEKQVRIVRCVRRMSLPLRERRGYWKNVTGRLRTFRT